MRAFSMVEPLSLYAKITPYYIETLGVYKKCPYKMTAFFHQGAKDITASSK
jgi:hypothetical protein